MSEPMIIRNVIGTHGRSGRGGSSYVLDNAPFTISKRLETIFGPQACSRCLGKLWLAYKPNLDSSPAGRDGSIHSQLR
jgi:hypothetical protein